MNLLIFIVLCDNDEGFYYALMMDCRTFWIHFCNIVMYDQFTDEVENLVNLASAALVHTYPAKGRCHMDCFI